MLLTRCSHCSSVRPIALAVATAVGATWIMLPTQSPAAQSAPEEIVVTASRRATTVDRAAFNIEAYSGDMLEQQRITNLSELARWVPGLTVVGQGPRSSDLMTVRGLNVMSLDDSEFLDNSSGGNVQTYLGDIPVYLDLKMFDIDRVEVLLGPQGTLYGASTLGGAIRYIPKAPDLQNATLDVGGKLYSLAHADEMSREVQFALNVPIVRDKLALRASVMQLHDSGFIDYPYLVREPGVSDPEPDLDDPAAVAANLKRVDDADWEHSLSARLSLKWQIADRASAVFSYYHQTQDVGARTINNRMAFDTGKYESGQRFLEPNDRQTDLFAADVNVDLGFATLTSATGVSDFDGLGQRDQTDLLLDFEWGYELFPEFAAYTRDERHERRVNEELRLVSNGAGPWGWIAGLFYNDYSSHAKSEEFTPGIPDFFGISPPTGDLEYRQRTDASLTEKALFGEVSYRFSPKWTLTLGTRLFDYETDQTVVAEVPFFSDVSTSHAAADDDGMLGKLNLAYSYSSRALAYLTVSQGYRIGGANTVPECTVPADPAQSICASPDEILVKPDHTTNYEIGWRSAWQDGRIKLNADIYDIEWKDIQTLGRTQQGAFPITVNGGGARSRGLELALHATTQGPWSFDLTYAYNHSELTTFAAALVDGVDGYPGDRLAGTPEQQGSFFVNYARPLANGMRLTANYGFTATGSILTKVGSRNDGETLGGYTVHSASVGLARDAWTATLYADNLTDKFATTGVRTDPTHIRQINGFTSRRYFRYVLRPRSVGIEFNYRFGR